MADFNASSKVENGTKLGTCVLCGGEVCIYAKPIWDDPGDCMPTIDGYLYYARCSNCNTSSDCEDSPKDVKPRFLKK